MNTYTFIMELDGGCYIKQVDAVDEHGALYRWLEKRPTSKIKKSVWKAICKAFYEEAEYSTRQVIKIKSVHGVWYAGCLAKVGRKEYMPHINIVWTAV